MASKRKRALAKVIKGTSISDCMYQVIGRLEEKPEVGKVLVYVVGKETHSTEEIIKHIAIKEKYHSFYPGRMIIQTDKNTYVADDFVVFNENSRRGSRLI